MGFGVLGVFLWLTLEVYGSHVGPRTSWRRQHLNLTEFSEPGIFNYSTLLLSEKRDALYVGAKDAIFELSKKNVSVKHNKVQWTAANNTKSDCTNKGKSKEDCLNYIRVLEEVDDERLYVCGTHAFKPQCDYLNLTDFSLDGPHEDGKRKCPFDPSQSFASVLVDGELYSGTAADDYSHYRFIYKTSPSKPVLRTTDLTWWPGVPTFVFADMIRGGGNTAEGEDDKIYFFYNEEKYKHMYDNSMGPGMARICKGDLGSEDYQEDERFWSSFLKTDLYCINDDKIRVEFNMMRDVFVQKRADWRDTLIYGVFTHHREYDDSSAICVFKMADVEEVFSKGASKKRDDFRTNGWVWYDDIIPPRPGACVNNVLMAPNINIRKLELDETVRFVLYQDPSTFNTVRPNKPLLVTRDVNYTQIMMDRVHALDGNVYDVIYTGTDKGVLHKSVVYEGGVHIVEEIQLLKNSEPIKNLLLSSETRSLYAGSDSGVVQSPLAFCSLYLSCDDCVLARDPYCAWNPQSAACVDIFDVPSQQHRRLIQSLNGDADKCPSVSGPSLKDYQQVTVKPGSSAELPCLRRSNLAQVMWKSNGSALTEASRFHLIGENGLLIDRVAPEDQGHYECWSVEWAPAAGKNFSRLLAGYVLALDLPPTAPPQTDDVISTMVIIVFFSVFLFLLLILFLAILEEWIFPSSVYGSCLCQR